MGDVAAAFPKRPIKATRAARRRGPAWGWLLGIGLLALPALIVGAIQIPPHVRDAYLSVHGVPAAATEIEGQCRDLVSRRTRKKVSERCDFDVTYTLRGEEGGRVLHGKGRIDNPPLFIPNYGPAAIYDPMQPQNMQLKPWLEKLGGRVGVSIFLLSVLSVLPLLVLVAWILAWRGDASFVEAVRRAQIEVLPVVAAVKRGNASDIDIKVKRAGASKDEFAIPFDGSRGRTPLMARGPGAGQYVVALIDRNGRAHLLDSKLESLDLEPAERDAMLRAALS